MAAFHHLVIDQGAGIICLTPPNLLHMPTGTTIKEIQKITQL
jgi:hypothetical protein